MARQRKSHEISKRGLHNRAWKKIRSPWYHDLRGKPGPESGIPKKGNAILKISPIWSDDLAI